jgi:hypothetical protein
MTGWRQFLSCAANAFSSTCHADEEAAAGEDEETARRFGWWPARSTEETVRAAYASRNFRPDSAVDFGTRGPAPG